MSVMKNNVIMIGLLGILVNGAHSMNRSLSCVQTTDGRELTQPKSARDMLMDQGLMSASSASNELDENFQFASFAAFETDIDVKDLMNGPYKIVAFDAAKDFIGLKKIFMQYGDCFEKDCFFESMDDVIEWFNIRSKAVFFLKAANNMIIGAVIYGGGPLYLVMDRDIEDVSRKDKAFECWIDRGIQELVLGVVKEFYFNRGIDTYWVRLFAAHPSWIDTHRSCRTILGQALMSQNCEVVVYEDVYRDRLKKIIEQSSYRDVYDVDALVKSCVIYLLFAASRIIGFATYGEMDSHVGRICLVTDKWLVEDQCVGVAGFARWFKGEMGKLVACGIEHIFSNSSIDTIRIENLRGLRKFKLRPGFFKLQRGYYGPWSAAGIFGFIRTRDTNLSSSSSKPPRYATVLTRDAFEAYCDKIL